MSDRAKLKDKVAVTGCGNIRPVTLLFEVTDAVTLPKFTVA
jgi:hypothetical protein